MTMGTSDLVAMPKSKGKSYNVAGNPYVVSIGVRDITDAGEVRISLTVRAEYGEKSFCKIRGLVNRSYWHDYPDVEEMRKQSIAITPAIVCKLIRQAHQSGWNPVESKSDFVMDIDNHEFKKIAESR